MTAHKPSPMSAVQRAEEQSIARHVRYLRPDLSRIAADASAAIENCERTSGLLGKTHTGNLAAPVLHVHTCRNPDCDCRAYCAAERGMAPVLHVHTSHLDESDRAAVVDKLASGRHGVTVLSTPRVDDGFWARDPETEAFDQRERARESGDCPRERHAQLQATHVIVGDHPPERRMQW